MRLRFNPIKPGLILPAALLAVHINAQGMSVESSLHLEKPSPENADTLIAAASLELGSFSGPSILHGVTAKPISTPAGITKLLTNASNLLARDIFSLSAQASEHICQAISRVVCSAPRGTSTHLDNYD